MNAGAGNRDIKPIPAVTEADTEPRGANMIYDTGKAHTLVKVVRNIHQRLPSEGRPAGIPGNANMAVLCAIIAFQQLDRQDETGARSEILDIAGHRMLRKGTPLLELDDTEKADDCWGCDNSNGTLLYHCDVEQSDERLTPCILCPGLTNTAVATAVKELIDACHQDNGTARKWDGQRPEIEAAIRESLDGLGEVATELARAGNTPRQKAAALAIANSAYHLLACASYLYEKPRKGKLGTVEDREEEFANLAYHALSGAPGETTVARQDDEHDHCDRITVIPGGKATYLCADPGSTPSRQDEQDEKCAKCTFHGRTHRPRLDELVEAT